MFGLTWFDGVMVILLAAIVVVGVQRKLAAALAGLATLLLWPLINLLGLVQPLVGLVVAIAFGVGVVVGLRFLQSFEWFPELAEPVQGLAGGLGGLLMGLGVVAALTLAFPASKNASGFAYPSARLGIANDIYSSRIYKTFSGAWNNGLAKAYVLPDFNK
jgi:hypothetical protein